MDDEELAAELEHVRADLVERASGPRDFQRYLSIMDLHMRAAWLLIALGRYDETIASASEANRTRTAAVALTRQPPPGAVLWQACEAKAVAHLARGQWSQAEEATHEALRDFEEEDKNYRLHELALQAQGACTRTGFTRSRRILPENSPSSMLNATPCTGFSVHPHLHSIG